METNGEMNSSTLVLQKKAEHLARLDKETNGDYVNSPYKLFHDGERFVAYVRRTESGARIRTYLEIMRPATHQGNVTLEDRPTTKQEAERHYKKFVYEEDAE